MTKTAAQLDLDIKKSLAKGATPTSVADWKKLIKEIRNRGRTTTEPHARLLLQQELNAANDGLRSASKVSAMKPTFVTDTNLGALTRLVVENRGGDLPSRVASVHAPHLKRCLQAGLIEPAGGVRGFIGGRMQLTAAGREAVGDRLISEIGSKRSYKPKENTFVPAEKRAEILAKDVAKHEAEIAQLETALANLKR